MEQKTMLLYFAGYKGHNSTKFQIIKDFYKDNFVDCVQFDQTLDFEADKAAIEKLIEGRDVKIIASSLGCLSALWLHFKYKFEIVLINPSLFPEETLKDSLSSQEIENIRRFKNEIYEMRYGKMICLYVAEDDERVDYRRFLDVFEPWVLKTTVCPYGGHSFTASPKDGHSFTAMREFLPMMNLWLWRKEIGPEDWPAPWDLEEWGFLPPYVDFWEEE